MAPEYVMHGQFSFKTDVYSFGVLVLEIISGKKNSCFSDEDSMEGLLTFVSIFFFIILEKKNKRTMITYCFINNLGLLIILV